MTTLTQYLDGIPATHRAATDTISAQLSLWAKSVAPEFQPFVFLPDQHDHPVYSDAAVVFDLAAEQILLADTPRTNEVPLLFVGYHAMNRFTRSRQTLGFVVTDQRILVQEDFAALFGRALPKHRMLPLSSTDPTASSHALITSVAGAYDWTEINKLTDDDANVHPPQFQLSQLLIAAVTSVVQLSQSLGLSTPGAPEAEYKELTASKLIPRLVELGIRERVRLPQDPKLPKILKKFGPKIGIGAEETIVFCVVDQTFIGVYGLVVTDKAVRSCDIMESPVVSVRDNIDPGSIRLNDKLTAIITEPEKAHVVPSHLFRER